MTAFDKVVDLIKAVRNVKNEMNVAPSKKVDMFLVGDAVKSADHAYIKKLAGINEITHVSGKDEIGVKVVSVISSAGEAFLPLGELVDAEKEKIRLTAEIANLEKETARCKALLANQGFLAKAPRQLVDKEKAKADSYAAMTEKLRAQLRLLEE